VQREPGHSRAARALVSAPPVAQLAQADEGRDERDHDQPEAEPSP